VKHLFRRITPGALLACAVLALAAPAHATQFKAGSYPATVKGAQIGTGKITTNAGTVSCKEVTYSGSLSAASETLTLSPAYSGCTAFGFISATIDVNGCTYRYLVSSKVSADTYTGTLSIVCGSNPLTITSAGCTETVGSQSGLSSNTYTNTTSASPNDIDVSTNISGISYTIDPNCAVYLPGGYTNGTWQTDATLSGTISGVPTLLILDP